MAESPSRYAAAPSGASGEMLKEAASIRAQRKCRAIRHFADTPGNRHYPL
jgi:hypothetical protein